jgi:predicted metal-binding protein
VNKVHKQLDIVYKTTTGNYYPLKLGYSIISSSSVPVDQDFTNKACRDGCRLFGLNGGCPPNSPNFKKIAKNYLLLLYIMILTDNYPPKVLKGGYYTRWVFVETFITSLTKNLGERIASDLKGYLLGSGHCISCKPKKCSVKIGYRCKDPKKRTFSLESSGVIVTQLMEETFGIKLEWWNPKDPKYIPNYMLKAVGILSNINFGYKRLDKCIESALNYYKATTINRR